MTTFVKLVQSWPRILVLYPAHLKISTLLESVFPLVKIVRENPQDYPKIYVSERGSVGTDHDLYQIIELITYINGKHVEIMAVMFIKEPSSWYLLSKEFIGHTLTELPDSPLPKNPFKTQLLSENFYLL